MTNETQNRDQLLQRIEQSYSELIRSIENLSEEQILEKVGDEIWSVKDHLAHVTAWEEVLLRFHLSGEQFEEVIGLQGVEYRVTPFDEINRHLFQKYSDWSYEEVKVFANRVHRQLISQLGKLSDAELQSPSSTLQALGHEAHPLFAYVVGNTYGHFEEHLETIRRIAEGFG